MRVLSLPKSSTTLIFDAVMVQGIMWQLGTSCTFFGIDFPFLYWLKYRNQIRFRRGQDTRNC